MRIAILLIYNTYFMYSFCTVYIILSNYETEFINTIKLFKQFTILNLAFVRKSIME